MDLSEGLLNRIKQSSIRINEKKNNHRTDQSIKPSNIFSIKNGLKATPPWLKIC